MEFKAKFFDELSTRELYEIARARTEVFLLEQKIICQDLDGVDYDSLHCFLEEDGRVLAYLRAYHIDGGEVKIGRVLSVAHGVGLGRRLMEQSFEVICEKLGSTKMTVNAQKRAEGFYQKMGFKTVSPVFLEEDIPHVKMVLDLAACDVSPET